MAPTSKTKASDWYSISVDTLRGWAILLVLAGAAALGYFGFRQWNQYNAEHDAAAVIDEVLVLSQRLQTESGAEVYRTEYTSATEGLQQARTHFAGGEFRTALDLARRSRALLVSVLDALGHHGAAGEAQFISVQGGVEFRNGESGEWESARARVSLRSGDYVKTGSSGSAELMFLDGTLYTVRPNTLFVVTRTRNSAGGAGEQSIRMEYGWVNLNTSQRSGTVSTPVAEARVDQQSEASVSYDQSTSASRFAALRGAMEVATSSGTTRSLQAMQQVVGAGAKISEAKAVAAAPTLLAPGDGVELNPASTKQLDLAWDAVPGAVRYALQVSRNRLFVDNIIDVDNRTKTRASLGVRGEGTFLWRVAALSKDGLPGAWSAARELRLSAHEVGVDSSDKAPPTLDLEDVKSYGSLFIVAGRTQPGCTVQVNGEAVTVEADGSFTKTVQVAAEGWSFVEVRARNAQGVETMRRHRVFVESL
ncbi:MAG: FecR domain-containing protein [Acidobacteriota bacterium]